MKTDRLIGILSILLQKEKCTAPELAEKFEVSRRTINRDIDALCKAGIPVSTVQGAGGGIRIMEGYRMDRTLLTSRDMQMILAGLRSLDSVSGSSYYAQLMEKLSAGAEATVDVSAGTEGTAGTSATGSEVTVCSTISREISSVYSSREGIEEWVTQMGVLCMATPMVTRWHRAILHTADSIVPLEINRDDRKACRARY